MIACLTLNGQETTYTCHVRSFCVYEGGAKILLFCPFIVNVGPFDLKQVIMALYYTCLQRCDNSVEVERSIDAKEQTNGVYLCP